MSNKTSNIELQELIKTYLDNSVRRQQYEELELEVKFGTKGIKRISRIDYENVIQRFISNGFTISSENTLLRIFSDYTDEKTGKLKTSNVRTELVGLPAISDYCKNNNIVDIDGNIIGRFLQKSPFKSNNNMIYPVNFDDFNFRVSLNNEKTMNNNSGLVNEMVSRWKDNKKTFRYLCRHTLIHYDLPLKIDMSIVKESNRRGKYFVSEYQIVDSGVFDGKESYEIEIEIDNAKIGIGTDFNTIASLDNVLKIGIKLVLSGLQNTNYPISYIEQQKEIKEYMKILWGKSYREDTRIYPKNFVGPSSYTLQVANILPENANANIPNIRKSYTVTDKADGERKLLFISNKGKMYFIDTNMNLEFTGSISNNSNVFNTIIDGEHILHNKKKDYINLYAAFDIYYLNNKDIRTLPFISTIKDNENKSRLPILSTIIKSLNVSGIIKNTLSPVRFECKTFYSGNESPEHIFKGCNVIIQKKKGNLFEYEIDGLIFTPMDLGVGANEPGVTTKPFKMTWDYSFKWKPPEFNTIDFLVTFKKLPSGEDYIGNIFQEGFDVNSASQLTQYKTVILRVGFDENKHGYINPCQNIIDDQIPNASDKDNEDTYKPMQFFPTNPTDNNAGVCNMILKSGASGEKIMMTEDEEIIEDNMIVEFRYDVNRKEQWKWVPLRVRYDKTADFRSGGKNYGNAYHVANSNWRTIHSPITEDMIITGVNIPNEMGDDDVYYNRVTGDSNTRALRDFHNLFVKKLLLVNVSKKGDTLVDLAVGKGGDLPKWISAHIKFVFGIDISRDNIQNRLDGCCARYLNYRKKFTHMPSAMFVNGNSGLNIRNADAIYSDKDKQITKAIFGYGAKDIKDLGKGVYKHYGIAENGFNVTSIQFAIHYMFETHETLHNFLRNVSEMTKEGGYFVGTSYDGKIIFNLLKSKTQGESEIIIENNKKMWEVTKQYDRDSFDADNSSIGYAIDVYQESINKTFREYLVNYDYLTRLLENYGFVLLNNEEVKNKNIPSSTGLFSDLYATMTNEIKRNKQTSNEYGQASEMTANERKVSFLNRFFIYKKVRNVDAESVSRNLMGNSITEQNVIANETLVAEKSVRKTLKSIKKPKKLTRKLKLRMATPTP